jgi:hypothetical protein
MRCRSLRVLSGRAPFICHYRLWAEPLPVIEDNLHGLPLFQADGTPPQISRRNDPVDVSYRYVAARASGHAPAAAPNEC